MRRVADVGVMALALFAIGNARATVSSNETTENYRVDLTAAKSLLAAFNSATPIKVNGAPFHGYTKWNVNWTFEWWEERDGRCRITSTTVVLTSKMTLPLVSGGTQTQRAAADRYLRALAVHEQGHLSIGKQAANDIDRAIRNLPTRSSCRELAAAAGRVGNELLQKASAKEREYDATTRTGETQGAKLGQ